jgi:ferredoxin-NADP reductase
LGYVDLVIKVYKGGLIDAFPDGGKMSQYLNSLSVGAQVDISGPWGANEYLGRGVFKVGVQTLRATKVGMLAGGTGITPMLQVSTGFPLMATDGH